MNINQQARQQFTADVKWPPLGIPTTVRVEMNPPLMTSQSRMPLNYRSHPVTDLQRRR
jgi:hypothetical protein